jgi:hypothetical protein
MLLRIDRSEVLFKTYSTILETLLILILKIYCLYESRYLAIAQAFHNQSYGLWMKTLSVLNSSSFSLKKEETSGFGLSWDKSDRSNEKRKFCVVQIENNKSTEVKL